MRSWVRGWEWVFCFPATGVLVGIPVSRYVFAAGGWIALQLFCECLVAVATVAVAMTRVIKACFDHKVKA